MEITLLALAMLREAGLEAYLALAVSRQFGVLRRDFLSPHQFDQAFVGLVLPDEGLLFLHPAAPHCPPLGIPWDVQGILVLICTPGGGGFARVPVSRAEDNLREHWIELAVGPRGDAAGTVMTTYRGQENMELKSLLAPLTPAQRADVLMTAIGSRLKNAEVGDLVIRNLGSYREPLEVEFSVRLPAFAKRQGNQLIFSPGLFAQVLLPDLDHERRTQPIYLPYPFVARIVEKISLPEDFQVQHVGPRSYRSDIGTHLVETEVLPRGLVWERKLVQQRIFFQRGEYFALQHFLSRIRNADSAATIALYKAR